MYCSECSFFRGDGLCKNPQVRKREVGYFQKACAQFVERKTTKQTETPTDSMEMNTATSAPQTKVCERCGRELPLDQFDRHYATKDKHTKICHECNTAAKKAGFRPKPIQAPATAHLAEEHKPSCIQEATDAELIAEIAVRGYKGNLSKTITIEL